MVLCVDNHIRKTQFLAAAVLTRVLRQGQNLQEALAEEIKKNSPEIPVRAAAQDCVYGVLRHWGVLSFFLNALLKTIPPDRPYYLLAVAMYQILYTKESVHAVVDQAVEGSQQRFKALTNGVLRRWLRQKDQLSETLSRDLVAQMSCPAWWIRRVQNTYPTAWKEILRSALHHPPMTLRVHQHKTTVDVYLRVLQDHGLHGRHMDEDAIEIIPPVAVHRLPHFADGWVSVQDWGAQHVACWLDPKPDMKVLDACAAPGGKTCHLIEYGAKNVVALDISARRLARVRENLNRLGFDAELKTGDARQPGHWWDGEVFDCILVDVPCSASGVVRRHPDIKWHRRSSDIANFASTQREILDALWPLLKSGGRMLYLTCSIFEEENRLQVESFLARHADAQPLRSHAWLPCMQHDGFYYALLGKITP